MQTTMTAAAAAVSLMPAATATESVCGVGRIQREKFILIGRPAQHAEKNRALAFSIYNPLAHFGSQEVHARASSALRVASMFTTVTQQENEGEVPLLTSALAIAAAATSVSSTPFGFLTKIGYPGLLLSTPSTELLALCAEQLSLCEKIVGIQTNLTVYVRTAESYASGQLEFFLAASYPKNPSWKAGAHKEVLMLTDKSESQGSLGHVKSALVQREAVELPESSALVLPLVKDMFLVGFLVAERSVVRVSRRAKKPGILKPVRPSWPPKENPELLSSAANDPKEVLLSKPEVIDDQHPSLGMFTQEQQAETAKIARTLALACVMDQRSLPLQQSSWQSGVYIDNLVDQVRGPLMAVRILGKMLLPHLKRGETFSRLGQGCLGSRLSGKPLPLPSSPYSRGNVSIRALFHAVRPISYSAVRARALPETSLSASPPEDSPGDDAAETESSNHLGNTERVIISTTKNSRSAKAIANEPELISDRYVRGSLKFQVELSQGFSLDETASVIEEDERQKDGKFRQRASETGEASTAGENRGQLWRSESYVRRTLKARYLTQTVKSRQRYKEVILRFPTTNLPVAKHSSRNEDTEDVHLSRNEDIDDIHDTSDGIELNDEEELYLRSALNANRQLASELFEAVLRAGQLGPKFTEALLISMPQFIDRIVTEAVALKKYSKYRELSFNSRVRLYLSNLKVVELIKWLKHHKLTAPRIGRLICTADESLGRIKSRVKWLRTIYVKGRDLGVIIERYPQILNLSLQVFNEKVEVLETAGIQRKWLGLIVSRQPKVLTLSTDEMRERISMFTELGLSAEQFGVMVFKFPAILGHFSVEEMQSKVDYLRQIGIEDVVLVKILVSSPQLLACSIEESWAKLLRYFYFLRIELSGIRRILGVNPSVFCLNLEENIAPKVKFLRAIGVHEEAIGQLIVDFPAILTYSLEKKIRPVVRFLLEEAGVTEEKVGKVITMQPELIRCSLPNKLLVLVKYLRSKGFKSSQIGGMIEDFPALLIYSVPALHPKFQYLIRAMQRSLADAVIFPRYFSYSLQSRIIPRHEHLKDKRLDFSLRHMLACSDDVFSSRVASSAAAEQTNLMTSGNWEDPDLAEDRFCKPDDNRSLENIS